MPKRIIDGEAGWASDKIAACSTRLPATVGVYYFWFYPLADANGNLELTNPVVIYRKVCANLPFLKLSHVKMMFSTFEQNGLLFTWQENGKLYGHWTGSEKPGRLPKPSDKKKYERLDCHLPHTKMQVYLNKFRSKSWLSPQEGPNRAPEAPQKGERIGLVWSGMDRSNTADPPPQPPQEPYAPDENAVFSGSVLAVTAEQHKRFAESFPEMNLETQYKEADLYLESHKSDKTYKNQFSFMRNWLSRAKNSKGETNTWKANSTQSTVGGAPVPTEEQRVAALERVRRREQEREAKRRSEARS